MMFLTMGKRWQPIATAPTDGRAVRVRRIFEGRLVAEGLAVFGEWHPDADYLQPDPDWPEWNESAAARSAERRWLLPDRMYAFPAPTEWRPDSD